MFGIGSKKPLSLERFPLDSWSVATGESDGKPLIIRVNAGARKFVAHPELPLRLGVQLAFRTPNEHGFPAKDEQPDLDRIEEGLLQALQAPKAGFCVLVLTNNGRREFVCYVRDHDQASKIVDPFIAATFSHQMCYQLEEDPAWAYYSQFA
jgi:hypothetical protein